MRVDNRHFLQWIIPNMIPHINDYSDFCKLLKIAFATQKTAGTAQPGFCLVLGRGMIDLDTGLSLQNEWHHSFD